MIGKKVWGRIECPRLPDGQGMLNNEFRRPTAIRVTRQRTLMLLGLKVSSLRISI